MDTDKQDKKYSTESLVEGSTKLNDAELLAEIENIGYSFSHGNSIDWSGLYEMAINEGYEYIDDGKYWVNKNKG